MILDVKTHCYLKVIVSCMIKYSQFLISAGPRSAMGRAPDS